MDPNEKLKLLQSVRLLDQIPERQLVALGEFLKAVSLKDGEAVFLEGTKGDSLYFVTKGRVRISKKAAGTQKDLAILGAGDCFGEMALVEDVARSASATAQGETELFQLGRADMNRWLKSHPELAVDFFAELVQVQSKRLRRTSNELAMLFDLSNLLLENHPSPKDLLKRVFERLMPHMEGRWSAAASVYNLFNDEMEVVAGWGSLDLSLVPPLPKATEERQAWLDGASFYTTLPGGKRPQGYLLFRAEDPLSDEDRAEAGRTLTTVARLIATAAENINYHLEDSLRSRLKSQAHGAGL